MFAKERLYLTADRERLVGYGNKAAATLYAAEGDEIPATAVEKFGLVDGLLPAAVASKGARPPSVPKTPVAPKVKASKAAGAKEQEPAKTKEQPAPANKEIKSDENKGQGSGAEQSQGA